MKLLLAYDGSRCAEAAIDDLYHAGLPDTGAAHVISVAEVWLPRPDSVEGTNEVTSEYVKEITRVHLSKNQKILDEAAEHVRYAEQRVRTALPGWAVTSSATYGSPAWEVLASAEELRSDMIVVGSHGRSAISRFFLGSISQKVLTEAHCSVRVARGKNQIDPAPARLVVGFDGSRGATAAIDEIAGRYWHKGTKVRLITATDSLASRVIGDLVQPGLHVVDELGVLPRPWVEQLADAAIMKLTGSGVGASFYIYEGSPKEILVKEAERWGADCIFVGANAYGSRLQRVLLGSTSGAVAARAHCSVEVVRTRAATAGRFNGNKEK
jgi:nucleotide-binding universal stress UspA family protein